MLDRRCYTPRRAAYATGSRRAGTPTIFCSELLCHLDLQIAPRYQLLQPRILLLEPLQAPHVVGLERSEPLLRGIDRTIAHAVALGYCHHRITSVSRKIPAICSSVTSDFLILCLLLEASLRTSHWSETPGQTTVLEDILSREHDDEPDRQWE